MEVEPGHLTDHLCSAQQNTKKSKKTKKKSKKVKKKSKKAKKKVS